MYRLALLILFLLLASCTPPRAAATAATVLRLVAAHCTHDDTPESCADKLAARLELCEREP